MVEAPNTTTADDAASNAQMESADQTLDVPKGVPITDEQPVQEETKVEEAPEASEEGRQPHHKSAKSGISDLEVQKQYAILIDRATAILVCNYSSLNMAINMGFAGRKHIASDLNENLFQARRGQVNELKQLVGGDLAQSTPADIAVRCQMINMLVEMMLQEEIEKGDLVEFMDDWMEENFNVIPDEQSHQDMAASLIKVRRELTYCALNDLDLPSGSLTLGKLVEFNERNRGNVQQMNQAAKEARMREMAEGGDSSGFEDCSGDDDDSGWSSDSDGDKPAKGKGGGKKNGGGGGGLNDSFEEVVDKKKKRN